TPRSAREDPDRDQAWRASAAPAPCTGSRGGERRGLDRSGDGQAGNDQQPPVPRALLARVRLPRRPHARAARRRRARRSRGGHRADGGIAVTRTHAAWAALVLGLIVHAVLGTIQFVRSPRPAADFDRYYEIASGSGRPYVEYEVEHPVGTLLMFKALAAPGTRAAFGRSI